MALHTANDHAGQQMKRERDLLLHMAHLISRYNAKGLHAKNNQLSVEIIINEYTMANKLINVYKVATQD